MATHKRYYSWGVFNTILTSALSQSELYTRISVLLDSNPYFIRGYLELLWIAERKGDGTLYDQILERGLTYVTHVYTSSELRRELSEHWTALDRDALKDFLQVAHKRVGWSSPLKKIVMTMQRIHAENLVQIKTHTAPTEEQHLRLIKQIPIEELKTELKTIPAYWWGASTERSEQISYHRHTHSIFLRDLNNKSISYNPVDGVHESTELPFASMFPKTHETVLALAKELEIGLGRVAIVKLKPYSQVYRHYDTEEYLRGRDRYHLVLDCGTHNLMESGNNAFYVREGQLWFFDNKVMHRTHNLSGKDRTHVIFDGFPLQKNS